jgi:hypothetical protein
LFVGRTLTPSSLLLLVEHRVLKALRTKKNPTKPSLGLYGRIAHAINHNESIGDFLNFFVGNLKADFPGKARRAVRLVSE